mmetsp:Transcript_15864/g.24344  ORF Transcript_15864/g.24344 Transcript_15864/m.24344 type:complete len:433 (+) Transcript_15864:70-1368(+)
MPQQQVVDDNNNNNNDINIYESETFDDEASSSLASEVSLNDLTSEHGDDIYSIDDENTSYTSQPFDDVIDDNDIPSSNSLILNRRRRQQQQIDDDEEAATNTSIMTMEERVQSSVGNSEFGRIYSSVDEEAPYPATPESDGRNLHSPLSLPSVEDTWDEAGRNIEKQGASGTMSYTSGGDMDDAPEGKGCYNCLPIWVLESPKWVRYLIVLSTALVAAAIVMLAASALVSAIKGDDTTPAVDAATSSTNINNNDGDGSFTYQTTTPRPTNQPTQQLRPTIMPTLVSTNSLTFRPTTVLTTSPPTKTPTRAPTTLSPTILSSSSPTMAPSSNLIPPTTTAPNIIQELPPTTFAPNDMSFPSMTVIMETLGKTTTPSPVFTLSTENPATEVDDNTDAVVELPSLGNITQAFSATNPPSSISNSKVTVVESNNLI